jgi:hypothetical protein
MAGFEEAAEAREAVGTEYRPGAAFHGDRDVIDNI